MVGRAAGRLHGLSARSSSMRRGRRFRTRTTRSVRICRRSTRRCCLGTIRQHAWFGPKPAWWPALLPFSPALLILPFPGLFRFTCYYYRGAYYKAFWADPPSCAVGEPRKSYWGEQLVPADPAERPPLLRLHRGASSSSCSPTTCGSAMWFADRRRRDGVRHRRRHAHPRGQRRAAQLLHARLPLDAPHRRRPQGRSLEVSRSATACYGCSSALNYRHQLFAWMSLFSVGVRRRLRPALLDGDLDRREDPLMAALRRPTPTTSSSSAPAAPGCARRSKPPTPA